jgi:hypothetical protein
MKIFRYFLAVQYIYHPRKEETAMATRYQLSREELLGYILIGIIQSHRLPAVGNARSDEALLKYAMQAIKCDALHAKWKFRAIDNNVNGVTL